MCKLCNTPEPPIIPRPRTPKTKLFVEVTKDYTGEYPCVKCMQSFKGRVSNLIPEDGMDKYILTRLYKGYRGFKVKTDVPGCSKAMYTYSSNLGVETITNNSTGTKVYRTKGIGSSTKCFKTFEEALNHKLEILSTGAHPKSLTRLTNKLKELQNG